MEGYNAEYAENYFRDKQRNPIDKILIGEYFITKIFLLQPNFVLDIGGGHGPFSPFIKSGYHVLEPGELIRYADDRVIKLNMSWLQFKKENRKNNFDLIISFGVLYEHIGFNSTDFEYVASILSPGGRFLFTAVKKYSKSKIQQFLFDIGIKKNGQYGNFLSQSDIKNLPYRSEDFEFKYWEYSHTDSGWVGSHYIIELIRK